MRGILWLSSTDQNSPEFTRFDQQANHLHITLQFGANYDDWQHLIGQTVSCKVVANCWNNKIQALKVELPGEYKAICQNEFPHMTISMAEGIRPVESNNMLKGEHNEIAEDFVIETIVEFYEFK